MMSLPGNKSRDVVLYLYKKKKKGGKWKVMVIALFGIDPTKF